MLTAAEVAERFPDTIGDWVGGMETASDGHAEPAIAVQALARAARAAGATVIEDCAVRTLDLAAGRVAGVVTERGRVRCEKVLLAAGAWSTHFAANAGLDLPQLAVRSTVARTEPAPSAPYETTLSTPGIHLRRNADGGYTVATGDGADHYVSLKSFKYFMKFANLRKMSAKDVHLHLGAPKGYPGAWGTPRRWSADETSPFERMRVVNPRPSPVVVQRINDRLPKRFPAMAGVKLTEVWAGMIDVTPDAVPTLGEDPALPGLYIATGMSGHGFGIGPAIGRVMADVLTGRPAGHDLARFRPTRFSDGSEIVPGPY
jgi:glycine/D-amino acid oxidase-like deaminating enzyme